MSRAICREIERKMKISDEFLAVILAGFLSLMGFIVWNTLSNSGKIDALIENDRHKSVKIDQLIVESRNINNAVNNVEKGEPTIRDLVETLVEDVNELKELKNE